MWGLEMLLLVIMFLFVFLLAAVFVFIFALFIAHVGYLHLVSASSMWCSSDLYSSLLEQMVLALYCREPITRYFDETGWLLSHWRYRSMCEGFLYTVVFRFPSSSGIIRISRNGMEPSLSASSLANCMCWSILFRCSSKLVFCADCRMVKVSSTNLQKRVWCGAVLIACCSNFSMYRFATMGLMGVRQYSNSLMMLDTDKGVCYGAQDLLLAVSWWCWW